MSKKECKSVTLRDAIIRCNKKYNHSFEGPAVRQQYEFCIFLPANVKSSSFDYGKPSPETAERLTEETGIKFRYSSVTDRIYTIASLRNPTAKNSIAREYYSELSDGDEWQVTEIIIYSTDGTFDLVQSHVRPDFKFKRPYRKGLKGMVYPEGEWPDTDYNAESENSESVSPFAIKNIIFSNPCTIVFWTDGTKTVVRCGENDLYDPEKGIAMAVMRKVYGPRHAYMKTLGPYIEEFWRKEEIKEQLVGAVGSNRLNFADILKGATGLFTGKKIIDKATERMQEAVDESETGSED